MFSVYYVMILLEIKGVSQQYVNQIILNYITYTTLIWSDYHGTVKCGLADIVIISLFCMLFC